MSTIPRINFDEVKVSTKTIIVTTNMTSDIEYLFKHLPITEYVVLPKKRGRRKKSAVEDPNRDLPDGSIITLKYLREVRGAVLKASKSANAGYFRNSLTVVMHVCGKLVNFKISENGKIQMTGCKVDEHAEMAVKHFHRLVTALQADGDPIITLHGEKFHAVFFTVMTNIDFSLGFNINRERLDQFINSSQTQYTSLLEASMGYTGVNIKIPLRKPTDLQFKVIEYQPDTASWADSMIPYSKYLALLDDKERRKEAAKERFHTFLVFQSGEVIMSSMHIKYMKHMYDEFIGIIERCKDQIVEAI
jgi:hypothetical protein